MENEKSLNRGALDLPYVIFHLSFSIPLPLYSFAPLPLTSYYCLASMRQRNDPDTLFPRDCGGNIR